MDFLSTCPQGPSLPQNAWISYEHALRGFLSKKKEIIVFNKIDLIEDKVLEEKLLNFSKKNRKNFNLISILNKNGLKKIKQIIIENVHT